MPVGHERINAREANPNENIVFIRALEEYPDHDKALELLKALAAQYKPIMKEWGFGVNSLVEYEHNKVFAGRNWNAGEIIEIVLRRADGRFLPYKFLLHVFSHELAHIREMNHSWAFQNVNKQINQALSTLRQGGYTGDGFWGRGRSLVPDYEGNDLRLGEEGPTYTCGGALRKNRGRRRRLPAGTGSSKPRAPRGSAVTLGTTGRQTRIQPKAGARVKRKGAFVGEGRTLGANEDEDGDEEEIDPRMSTKGKRAQSNAARQARSIAAEARLAAEQRAKAAEARLGGSNGAKVEDGLDEDGGWEFEEEEEVDKPRHAAERLGKDEREWLRGEMERWDEEEEVGGRGGAPTSSRRRKRGHSSSPSVEPSLSRSQRKRRASTEILEDDLTKEEIAMLSKLEKKLDNDLEDVKPVPESDDDDIIIVEPSTSTSKKKK